MSAAKIHRTWSSARLQVCCVLALVLAAHLASAQPGPDWLYRDLDYPTQSSQSLHDEAIEILAFSREAEAERAVSLLRHLLAAVDPEEALLQAKTRANLAWAQSLADQGESAFAEIDLAIDGVEAVLGRYDRELARLFMLKGAVLRRQGADDRASSAFQSAQNVIHRNAGVLSIEQLPAIDQLLALAVERSDHKATDVQQQLKLKIFESEFGDNSAKLVDALVVLGNHYRDRASQYPAPSSNRGRPTERDELVEQAVAQYRRASGILRTHAGDADPRFASLAFQESAAWLLVDRFGRARSAAEAAAERVARVWGLDSVEAMRALTVLADTYVLTGDARARRLYEQVWVGLSAQPELREALFGQPLRLRPRDVPHLVLRRRPDGVADNETLYHHTRFDVLGNGKVSRVRVLATNITAESDRAYRHQLQDMRFRPRMVNGEVVATRDLRHMQEFGLRPFDPFFPWSKEAEEPAFKASADKTRPVTGQSLEAQHTLRQKQAAPSAPPGD